MVRYRDPGLIETMEVEEPDESLVCYGPQTFTCLIENIDVRFEQEFDLLLAIDQKKKAMVDSPS